MIDFYLITGFLGAGKTTFMSSFMKQFKDKKTRLVINEFGKAGVDGKLLAKMDILLEEIDNGSIFCACRIDQFEEVLTRVSKQDVDVLIVEASGLSDPTSVRRILQDNPNFNNYNYKGCICLVDCVNFHKVFKTARVCPRQLSISDLVILNKIDLVDENRVEEVKNTISEQYPLAQIETTSFGEFNSSWLKEINPNKQFEIPEYDVRADITLQKSFVKVSSDINKKQLQAMLNMICEDTNRIKGFVKLGDCDYLVDGVGTLVNITPYDCDFEVDNVINFLATAKMNLRKAMKKAIEVYKEFIVDYKL